MIKEIAIDLFWVSVIGVLILFILLLFACLGVLLTSYFAKVKEITERKKKEVNDTSQ